MAHGKIKFSQCSLNLKMMLEGGQCFRWKETAPFEWTGVFSNLVWSLRQYEDCIEYTIKGGLASSQVKEDGAKTVNSSSNCDLATGLLRSYLNLDAPLEKYYEEWSNKDPNFKKISAKCYGIRILNQDPVENVFSFICSSNNNIKRISSLVEKLSKLYGPKLCEVDGVEYYGFPEISDLAASQESDLRKAGFGYRAKFIYESSKQLHTLGGLHWLEKLKDIPYSKAKTELMKLPGIGAKVADCICLMSLGHLEALPVDTHVYQIASQNYMPHLKKVKNLTDRIYNEIGDHFRDLYGPLAGWAHTVLFCGDLKTFKDINQATEKRSADISAKEKKLLSEKIHPPKKTKTQPSSIRQEIQCISGILKCSRQDLNLRITLNSGQTYRFKELSKDLWRGVFARKVWTLKQHDSHIDFTAKFMNESNNSDVRKATNFIVNDDENHYEQLLHDYFRLDVPLSAYYKRWSECDKHFKEISDKFYGLRMIKQDIVENLFTFICSSCNTISRMTSMVESMCSLYGQKIAEIDGKVYFDFPVTSKLAHDSVEKDLLKYNFGYRAKYVQQAAEYIVENGGDVWFDNLKEKPYEEAKVELMKLPGIAAKVADCICLTALGHLETIPVDTHVFQIAKRYYLPHLHNKKTVTPAAYNEIGNCFRNIFGHYSGWAHTVLFASDLKQHKNLYTS